MSRMVVMGLVTAVACGPARPAPAPTQQPTPVRGPIATPSHAPDAGVASVSNAPAHATFVMARDCSAVTAAPVAPVAVDKVPGKPKTPVKIAPPASRYEFDATGSYVVYTDDKQGLWKVPASGGTPAPTSVPVRRAPPQLPASALELAKAHQGYHGDIQILSASYATFLAEDGATYRLFALDVGAQATFDILPPGLAVRPIPRPIDDTHVGLIGSDNRMYVVDVAAREVTCATIAPPAPIAPFYAVTSDLSLLVYFAGTELRVADLVHGTDTAIATLPGVTTVVMQRVPRKHEFIVHVRFDKTKTMAFFAVDGSSIVRLTPDLPGWSNMEVSPDGATVVFRRGDPPRKNDDWRPPMPPLPERPPPMPGQPSTCDPVGCSGGGPRECGWQSNGCWGYNWCGHCPDEPKPPPVPVDKDAGLYTFTL